MDREQVEALCESLPGAWPDTPWEDDLVYKLGPTGKGKIFCFLGGGTTEQSGISIKVDPALVPLLHQKYEAVSSPAYLSKQHWIAVQLNGDMPEDELEELIEDSWRLVAAGLPKRMQRAWGLLA